MADKARGWSAATAEPVFVRIRDFLSAHPGSCLLLAAGFIAAAGSFAVAVNLLRQGAAAALHIQLIAAGAAIALVAFLILTRSLLRQLGRQKRLAAKLEGSRRSLETTQRVAKIGSWAATFESGSGGSTQWSPEVYRIFGVEAAAWRGTVADFESLVHPDDRPAVERTRDHAMQSGAKSYGLDYRIRRPDGAVRWVQTQAEVIRGPAGRAVHIVGTVQDITERKEVEEALRRSEARLRDYAETASDWFWETGPDHRFIDMSRRIEVFGQRAQSRIGRLRRDLAADRGEQPEKWRQHMATLDRHEPFRDFVYRMQVDDEAEMAISVSGRPFFGANGEFLGYRGTAREVTGALQAEERLREAKTAAEAASAAKTSFLANMSHELRTPLNAIIGFAEALTGGYFGALNDKQAEYVRDIKASGNHLLLLISDLLDVSKIEAGKLELHREMIDIREEITACLRIVQPKADQGRVMLETNLPPDLPDYLADRRALKQVLLNLLSNAVKFTPPGGRVTVEASGASDGDLAISVCDTGIGIAPQDLPKIVVPFSSLGRNANLSRGHEGTGLGLPLSKSLVEMHGGKLEIVSELGRGTIATVRFPAMSSAA